ncbi:MAG: ABC transporter ATP-binding protein [Eggerthellaceae bacterium]|nr:ABC transporter ATP-binding protein [Eggerthellaceae bacterium]
MPFLQVKKLKLEIKGKRILSDVNFELGAGQWLCVLGPNGAGKSSLAKCLNASIDYYGEILFEGMNLQSLSNKQRANFVSTLAQMKSVSYPYTVKDIVELGLYSREGYIKSKDNQALEEVLAQTGLSDFAERSVHSLSGGELQRVFFAQTLLQNPRLMILDEPTNQLDLKYQKLLLDGVKFWIGNTGGAVISILHDVKVATKYADLVLFLKEGDQVSFGSTKELVTADNLLRLFDVNIPDLC